jgi:hypothetical protein
MDFRVGGRERAKGRFEGGVTTTFDVIYHDIVPRERSTPCAQASISCTGQPWDKPGHDGRWVAARPPDVLGLQRPLATASRATILIYKKYIVICFIVKSADFAGRVLAPR